MMKGLLYTEAEPSLKEGIILVKISTFQHQNSVCRLLMRTYVPRPALSPDPQTCTYTASYRGSWMYV